MSWIFHEPFEPAIHAHRRAFAPLVARRGFSRTRSFHSHDLFSEEPPPTVRRVFSPRAAAIVAPTPNVNAARRLLPALLAAGVWDEIFPVQPHARFVSGFAPVAGDAGMSASVTVSFTGVTPDTGGPTGLHADTIGSGDRGLAAQTLAILAVDESGSITLYSGQSASRVV